MDRTCYVFLAEGFEEIEALTVVDLLRRAGIKCTTVSINDADQITGSHSITVACDAHISDINIEGEDVLILPGGMPGNMNNLMKQAQRMQRQMEENKKALEEKEFTATAGGGAVEVVLSGKKELKSIMISPDAVDPDDVEMLQDLVIAAVNEALRMYEAESDATVSKLTGGMGGFGF